MMEFDPARSLRPARRAIGTGRVLHGAVLGFLPAAILTSALLIAVHIWHVAVSSLALLPIAGAGALIGALLGLTRWPSAREAARMADRHFDLHDRLTTALELRAAAGPVAQLQRRDTAARVEGLKLREAGRPRAGRCEAAGGGAALVLGVLLALGPVRGAPTHATVAAGAPVRHASGAAVRHLAAKLQTGLTPAQLHDPTMRQVQRALARLQNRLQHAGTPTALRDISLTQQQIQALARGLHPINARAVAQLNSSLGRYLQPGARPTSGKAPGKPSRTSAAARAQSAAATARALSALSRALSHLTPAQRGALAQALARAANSTQNNSLRSALRQAAAALATGSVAAAASLLQQMASALSQSASQQATQGQLLAAGNGLQSIKSQIAGTVGPAAPASAVAAAGGSTPRAGKVPGAGKGTGQGRGTGKGRGRGRGQGRGKGQGRGSGRGQSGARNGQGQNRGAATGRGRGGTGVPNSTRAGRTVTVYVAGKQSNGATIVQTGPSGSPQAGEIVPYRQVVVRYAATARQALDRSALPPSLQSYVRRYFSAIAH